MFVNEPMVESTLWNTSGCSHAAVNEQMPPELAPQIACSSGSFETGHCFSTSGRVSSRRNRAYLSPSESYSFERSEFFQPPGGFGVTSSWPGLMNTATVGGITP